MADLSGAQISRAADVSAGNREPLRLGAVPKVHLVLPGRLKYEFPRFYRDVDSRMIVIMALFRKSGQDLRGAKYKIAPNFPSYQPNN